MLCIHDGVFHSDVFALDGVDGIKSMNATLSGVKIFSRSSFRSRFCSFCFIRCRSCACFFFGVKANSCQELSDGGEEFRAGLKCGSESNRSRENFARAWLTCFWPTFSKSAEESKSKQKRSIRHHIRIPPLNGQKICTSIRCQIPLIFSCLHFTSLRAHSTRWFLFNILPKDERTP